MPRTAGTVNHRPLMQAMAAEEWGACCARLKEAAKPFNKGASGWGRLWKGKSVTMPLQ